MTTAAHTGCWTPDISLAVSASTNRITTSGYNYDTAGNLTADGSLTYQWDGESRLKSLNSGSMGVYTYDGDGRRVMKPVGSVTTKYFCSAQDGQAPTELGSVEFAPFKLLYT